MKTLRFAASLFFVMVLSMTARAQKNTIPYKHSGIIWFGGQSLVSLNYEYAIVSRKH